MPVIHSQLNIMFMKFGENAGEVRWREGGRGEAEWGRGRGMGGEYVSKRMI